MRTHPPIITSDVEQHASSLYIYSKRQRGASTPAPHGPTIDPPMSTSGAGCDRGRGGHVFPGQVDPRVVWITLTDRAAPTSEAPRSSFSVTESTY